VASTALSEDVKKASTSGSKKRTADTFSKGRAKSIVEGNDAETKAETGTLAFFCFVEVMALIILLG